MIPTVAGALGIYDHFDEKSAEEVERARSVLMLKGELTDRYVRISIYLSQIIKRDDSLADFTKLIGETGPVVGSRTFTMGMYHDYAGDSLYELLNKLKKLSKFNCIGDKMLEAATLSAKEIPNIIIIDTSGGTPESKLGGWIRKVKNKIRFIYLVGFLDEENKFSQPSANALTEKLLDDIKSMRVACDQANKTVMPMR